MGIEPTEDASQRPPPVLKTGPVTRSGRATMVKCISVSSRGSPPDAAVSPDRPLRRRAAGELYHLGQPKIHVHESPLCLRQFLGNEVGRPARHLRARVPAADANLGEGATPMRLSLVTVRDDLRRRASYPR